MASDVDVFGTGDGHGARRAAYDPAMRASAAAATASRERPVAAYAACRRMLRRHDPTYYLAVLRLPADVRPAVHALYGLCAARTRSSTGRVAPWNQPRASPPSTRGSANSSAGWPEGRPITR